MLRSRLTLASLLVEQESICSTLPAEPEVACRMHKPWFCIVSLTLCCIWRQMTPTCWMHKMPDAHTSWTHMTPNFTKGNLSLKRPVALWQIGVEQIQTPLQIPHLMGNLERCFDLLYTYLSQSSWGHKWWINLGAFWRRCIQRVDALGVICSKGLMVERVGIVGCFWRLRGRWGIMYWMSLGCVGLCVIG